MGAIVFDNKIFDEWLDKKAQDILSKVDRERITTQEMIILVLKAQTNHFHHMDLENRDEFRGINRQFTEIKQQFKEVDQRFKEVDRRFNEVDQRFNEVDQRFNEVDQKFKEVDRRFDRLEDKFDKRFDKLYQFLMWQGGALLALFSGIYLKLFFV